jgi:hypothetical protein
VAGAEHAALRLISSIPKRGTLLGVGVVGAAVATLWIVTSGDSEEPAVQAHVGLGTVSLRGTF